MQTILISTRLFSVYTMIAWSARYVFLNEQMYGEKHIDRYPHRTSPMDTYKHEFKKSESRLVLGNTIPLSPCSFLVAWLSRDLRPIEPFPFDLSRRDDKRRYVLGTNVWQTWRVGAGRWFRKDFSSGNLPRIDPGCLAPRLRE